MRDLIRAVVDGARRSTEGIGGERSGRAADALAAESIRLARLATAMHLSEHARRTARERTAATAEERGR